MLDYIDTDKENSVCYVEYNRLIKNILNYRNMSDSSELIGYICLIPSL